MYGQPIPNSISIASAYALPDGVRVLEIEYDGTHSSFKKCPAAIRFNGLTYGRASHNSDAFRVVYRNDVSFASVC